MRSEKKVIMKVLILIYRGPARNFSISSRKNNQRSLLFSSNMHFKYPFPAIQSTWIQDQNTLHLADRRQLITQFITPNFSQLILLRKQPRRKNNSTLKKNQLVLYPTPTSLKNKKKPVSNLIPPRRHVPPHKMTQSR